MSSLGGGRSFSRRPGSCYCALTLLLILFTASAIDCVFPGGSRNTGEPLHLFTVAAIELQIQVDLTVVFRSILVDDPRPPYPPSTPKKSSAIHSTMALWVRVSTFNTLMTISPRLIAGHGQTVCLGGRTFTPHLLSFTRVRYGNNISTYCIVNLDLLFRIGCLNLNGYHGGVSESVNPLAPLSGRCNQRTIPILDRFCDCHPVLCAGVLYRSFLGPDFVAVRPLVPDPVTAVVIPAFYITSARTSSSSKATWFVVFFLVCSGGWEAEGATNPNGSDGPVGLYVEFSFPVWWALKPHPNQHPELLYAGPRIVLLFSGPMSLYLVGSLCFNLLQLYAVNPLVSSQGFVLKKVIP